VKNCTTRFFLNNNKKTENVSLINQEIFVKRKDSCAYISIPTAFLGSLSAEVYSYVTFMHLKYHRGESTGFLSQ